MARKSKGGDPAANKYQATFKKFIAKNAVAPKSEDDGSDAANGGDLKQQGEDKNATTKE